MKAYIYHTESRVVVATAEGNSEDEAINLMRCLDLIDEDGGEYSYSFSNHGLDCDGSIDQYSCVSGRVHF